MKNALLPLLLLLASTSCSAQPNPKYTAQSSGSNRIEVLDFHNEHRCATCLEIEKLTKKILNEDYADAMKKGLITFKLVNVDDKANADMVHKYTAYGTTLIISSVKGGAEEFTDLTNFAFLNFNKADKFKATLKKELDAALQRIRS
ncbi:MAG: nitrophenyl compound nitroreductase subunit ArsF family protein [Saprospiraceae bacterium]